MHCSSYSSWTTDSTCCSYGVMIAWAIVTWYELVGSALLLC